MIRAENTSTVYEMVAKGAILVVKRLSANKYNTMLMASLVVPQTGGMVEVESATAKRATNSGRMRRMGAVKEGNIMGYRDLGFRDEGCEYWVMVQ